MLDNAANSIFVHIQLLGNLANVGDPWRCFNLDFPSTDIGLGASCMWPSCPRTVCEVLCDVVLVLHLVVKTHGHTEPADHILDFVISIDAIFLQRASMMALLRCFLLLPSSKQCLMYCEPENAKPLTYSPLVYSPELGDVLYFVRIRRYTVPAVSNVAWYIRY